MAAAAAGRAAGAGGITGSSAGPGVPCDVAPIVSQHCTNCHAKTPQFGAPMPLMTVEDFQAPTRSAPTLPVHKTALTRISATEAARMMPPVTSSKLAAAEMTTFSAWLSGGAVAAAQGCAITEPTSQPTAGSGGTLAPSTRSGGATIEPQEYNDPDLKCYKFLTHAAGDMDAPYMQGAGEQYVNFSFKAPWTGTAYLRAVKIAVENAPVLHHWLFFKDASRMRDGQVSEVGLLGVHTDGAILLYGWAPGATPLYFDPDVGMQLESTVSYTLEAHLNNSTGRTMGDHNGVEICVTSKVPAHIADITWVGTDSISGTSARGTCTPGGREPIHVIAAQPHMHKKGNHMKVVVNRRGASAETIHDHDFDFDDQRYYIEDTILMPGDTMTTTCSYSSPATFGPSTSQEMCYFFSVAWPAGSLNNNSGALLHGANTCLN
jgi:hypothetical protein